MWMRLLLASLALSGCAAGQRAVPITEGSDGGRADLAGFLGGDDASADLLDPNVDLAGADLTPSNCNLKVNEVQTGGAGGATDEFIEIYNTCDAPIGLTGYKLIYRAATATSDSGTIATLSGSVAKHGYFLVANSGYAGTNADIKPYNGTINGLAATGGAVGIRDAGGTLLDSVGWGSANNLFVETAVATAPATARSIARHPDGADNNDNATDFTDSTPTPKASN
jgi:hypothetical protein